MNQKTNMTFCKTNSLTRQKKKALQTNLVFAKLCVC